MTTRHLINKLILLYSFYIYATYVTISNCLKVTTSIRKTCQLDINVFAHLYVMNWLKVCTCIVKHTRAKVVKMETQKVTSKTLYTTWEHQQTEVTIRSHRARTYSWNGWKSRAS